MHSKSRGLFLFPLHPSILLPRAVGSPRWRQWWFFQLIIAWQQNGMLLIRNYIAHFIHIRGVVQCALQPPPPSMPLLCTGTHIFGPDAIALHSTFQAATASKRCWLPWFTIFLSIILYHVAFSGCACDCVYARWTLICGSCDALSAKTTSKRASAALLCLRMYVYMKFCWLISGQARAPHTLMLFISLRADDCDTIDFIDCFLAQTATLAPAIHPNPCHDDGCCCCCYEWWWKLLYLFDRTKLIGIGER